MNTDVKQRLYFVGLVRAFAFEASHQLPEYHGKCAHLHGHSYHGSIQVTADPRLADKSGIVVDFNTLKGAVNNCIMCYDHKHLNDFFATPTAELMVIKITQDLASYFIAHAPGCTVARVELWETANCGAIYPAVPENNLNRPPQPTEQTVMEVSSYYPFQQTAPRTFPKE